MVMTSNKKNTEQVAKYADMFSALGTEPRLRIMQLLLSAHPDGLVVGEIQAEQRLAACRAHRPQVTDAQPRAPADPP